MSYLDFLICQEHIIMVLYWIIYICPSRFILHSLSPSFSLARRLIYLGCINGLSGPVASKWVYSMGVVSMKLEKRKRVRLGEIYFLPQLPSESL